ncbi:MAG TPA: NAD-dependent epimerase/dehydratase family protein [Thermoleophilaceae bacterium]|nr:NAD-dependent epimerase/dehydratase family protein [Thermoleophilaceae bacterium]
MRVLVTGATGKVGHAVARALVERGDEVRALVRNAGAAIPAGAEPVRGDVRDSESLVEAVRGCELVFNAMGLPEQWLPDERTFHEVNAAGSENVARAARAAGVRRLVHTSTIDVFHAERGARFDESQLATYPKGTAYERSKQEAERLVLGAVGGMDVVMVNPAGVYGPGPSGSASLEEDFFRPLVRGRLPGVPPGGMGVCFADGVAAGHLLAAERGRPGERYILCDRHVTMRELADTVVRVAGRGRVPLSIPPGVARGLAVAGEFLSRAIQRPPLLPTGQLHFMLWDAAPDSSKAQDELGWEPTALDDGVRRTLESMGLA